MRSSIALVVLAIVVDVAAASAQSGAHSVVGDKSRLMIAAIDGQSVGSLARAANVPMGAELVTPLPRRLAIRTAGRRLREILDEIVAADPRYEWRDVDGVVVIRPSTSWSSSGSALHVPVRSLSLQNIDASDAITALALMVEHRTAGSLPDTRLFSVDIPDGSTFLEALNAMVRAHGSLAWVASPPIGRVAGTDPRDQRFVKSIMLFSGSSGMGFSVREGSFFTSDAIVIERHDRDGTGWTFDWGRVVPLRPDGQPFEASSIAPSIVSDLARAMRMPMGIESLPPAPAPVRRLSPGDRLAGRSDRERAERYRPLTRSPLLALGTK